MAIVRFTIAAGAVALAQQERDVAILAAEKTKQVALAEAAQKLEVAQLAAQAAEQEKLALILKGEGEAAAAQLRVNADGGLEKKLEAYVKVNEAFAQALGNYTGNWVPTMVMGSSSTTTTGTGSNTAQQFMDMLMMKTAKDLSLDVAVPAKAGNLDIKKPVMNEYKYKPAEPTAAVSTRE